MTENEWAELSPEEAYFQSALQYAQYRLILREIPPEEECEGSEELDRRVLRLIDERTKKQRTRKALKKGVAAFVRLTILIVLLLNLALTTVFAVSGEVREQVLNLFLLTKRDHTEIKVRPSSYRDSAMPNTTPQPSDYRLCWLPGDEFKKTESVGGSRMNFTTYKSSHGSTITLDVYSSTSLVNLNTEGMAQKTVNMGEKEIVIFHQREHLCLIWSDAYYNFVLQTYGLTESEALSAAMSVYPVQTYRTDKTYDLQMPDYEVSWLPNAGLTVFERLNDSMNSSVTYTSDNAAYIILDVCSEFTNFVIDTEGLVPSSVTFRGREMRMFSEDGRVVLIWEEEDRYFVMDTGGLTESEALLAALSVRPMEDPGTEPAD